MTTLDQVEKYLKELRFRVDYFGIIIMDSRLKNAQTLHDLDIPPDKRKEIIRKLRADDFSEGPLDVKFNGLDMWVFGKVVKDKEIYIKVVMGVAGTKAICISFHEAEFPMNYPFKK